MKKTKFATREEWLQSAVVLMTPHFKKKSYTVPAVRVSCGWPSSRALSSKGRCLGEAWSSAAAADKIPQIFITPYLGLDNITEILATLVHEVCHTVVGNEHKHDKVFGACARAVGLDGKLTATIAGENLIPVMKVWAKDLGPFPHSKLDLLKRPTKKQTTRLIKCVCGECGYTCRTTRKWIEDVGAPICPAKGHGVMAYEMPDDLEFEGEEENE